MLTLLVEQGQWKSVPKVLLSFSEFLLAVGRPSLAEQNSSPVWWGFASVAVLVQ